ncbi:UbiD family decarboxylase [Actinomadura kijaniata]|uniref:UbiD family decarboxylase n=1 Tax=Actinomadura namibiensis TaxID=182080 RepID=A0A7W3QMF7_ACTNM|nr:UbiD family decarboxylase [Actinomadura namibiensis]MBA8952529.1 UbiD family decarboxylase [Actinomadura namibiensis]
MTLSPRQDLHAFLDAHDGDDVLVVDAEVSAEEEVTALAFGLAARGRHDLLRCPRVAGLGVELVTNVFASRARVAGLLGTDPAGLHAAYQERFRDRRPMQVLAAGPALDEVLAGDRADLAAVPMIRHFASDLGRYLTSGIVVAEDPDGGAGNMSYHRATPHSPRELALSLHSRGDLWRLLGRARERGRPLPVAMVVGGHPLFMLAASARVGADVDEREIAGGLFGEPLQVVRTPRHGIRVPATADYVIEGVIDPGDHAPEGPFGEFSGYSSHRSTNNVLRVETVCRRRDPVLLDVVAGNSAEHLNLARIPRESEMAEQLTTRFPDVTALHYPNSGTHFHAYVALRQRRPGQARQVMLGLLGWDPYLKTVVAVDDDVNVTDDAAVLWALAAHLQPHRDVFVVDGLPGSPLDPSSGGDGTTSRMALDATRGPGFDGEPIELSPAARDRAARLLDRALPARTFPDTAGKD